MIRILLVQARDVGDPMLEHELDAFARQSGVPRDAFATFNLCEGRPTDVSLDAIDAIMIGGSGDYSLAAGGFPWHGEFLELMRTIARREVPTFASCFGFQALVQALGGEVVSDPDAAEVGSFEIHLTEDGIADPLFGSLPIPFVAQLGHNDSVRNIPSSLVRLARSERCQTHAIRLRSTNVVATQFHPELTMDDNITRYIRYLYVYNAGLDPEEAERLARSIHAPSPESNALLRRFVASVNR